MPRLLPLLFVLAAGCGGSRAASFDGATFKDGPVAFQIGAVPSTWKRLDVSDASLAFRDDPHAATVLLNARCRRTEGDVPLVALTNHLLMGSTERDVKSQEVETFDRREALHTKVRAKWDGVPLALDIFVLRKDGCVYDFVYTAPIDSFEAGTADFETFVRGFRTLPGSGVVKREGPPG